MAAAALLSHTGRSRQIGCTDTPCHTAVLSGPVDQLLSVSDSHTALSRHCRHRTVVTAGLSSRRVTDWGRLVTGSLSVSTGSSRCTSVPGRPVAAPHRLCPTPTGLHSPAMTRNVCNVPPANTGTEATGHLRNTPRSTAPAK